MPPEPKPTTAQPLKPQDDTIKETFESIVIAFILAFVFRAYVVEAFVIPTGSMAPTLLGEHLRITCSQCGYHFKVDSPGAGGARKINVAEGYRCPMCQFTNAADPGTYISAGDRILVHKYLYSLSEPKRWDVVVFKAPHKPQTNYIKRLVGLPLQETMILEGNIYYNPTPGDETGWRIARKTDSTENPHARSIQQAVWQHVYHSQYVPLDFDPARSRNRWQTPWIIDSTGGAEVTPWDRGTASDTDVELDPRDGFEFGAAGKGALRFAFPRVYDDTANFFAYQQIDVAEVHLEDVRLAVAVEPKQAGLNLTLRTTSRLDDKAGVTHGLLANIDAQGNASLRRSDQEAPLATVQIGPLEPGVTRRIELWYVDQEASLWIDDERVLVHQFDGLKYRDLLARAGPFQVFEGGASGAMAAEHRSMDSTRRMSHLDVPVVKVEVQGSPVALHRIELDRDLFYTQGRDERNRPGKGAVTKLDSGGTAGSPARLKADEFFCLGDNSPRSQDSRAWNSVDPWVMERSFVDAALETESVGIVPRRLMMGKAFFVYFPTLIGTSPQAFPYFPNFGEMRFIH